MLKDKDKVVEEMMLLLYNNKCSDKQCEECSFISCCMCVRALEVLYDNGFCSSNEQLKQLESENESLRNVLCNSMVQAHNEVITRLRQLGERLKCKVLRFRCEGYAIHPFFFEIDRVVEDFIDSYERKN